MTLQCSGREVWVHITPTNGHLCLERWQTYNVILETEHGLLTIQKEIFQDWQIEEINGILVRTDYALNTRDYVRMKNIEVGYNFADKVCKYIGALDIIFVFQYRVQT